MKPNKAALYASAMLAFAVISLGAVLAVIVLVSAVVKYVGLWVLFIPLFILIWFVLFAIGLEL